ncbi:MAG: hypothetical protein M3345_04380, partial [Actinomycetota bacterium]|nr:hypothetical protein [Actinomycetota bacterium]
MNVVLAHGGTTLASYGTDWLYLLVPFLVFFAIVGFLVATGKGTGAPPVAFLLRIDDSLQRISGLPGWSAAGIGVGLLALVVAVIGFYWDVAWHIEIGRDTFIFTPAHMMIVMGLGLILVAAATSILFATIRRAEIGMRLGALRVPYSAIPLALLGLGALTGFPLDELWHRSYGIDVTMWGPTHLVMISGASLAPIAMSLMLFEARGSERRTFLSDHLRVVTAGATLTGLSTWTGEFDFGVPQFQQLYHPMLVMVAASIGLVAARTRLGAGGALKAVGVFVAARLAVALVIGTSLNLIIPRFPLYIGAAIVVEIAARTFSRLRPVPAAAVTGTLVGTIGLATEWGWTQLWGHHPWGPSLFPGVIAAAAIAIPGAILGRAMGEVLSDRRERPGARALALCVLAVVALLALPFPRRDTPIAATLTTESVSAGRVQVEVEIDPADAAEPADWFEVLSWQGGALQLTEMEELSPGRYRSAEPVPVGGQWKTFVRLARGDVLVAIPVFLPADPAIGASEIPVAPSRDAEFQRDTELLLREAHAGSSWPALVAYSAILLLAVTWIAALFYS